MITVQEARQLIAQTVTVGPAQRRDTHDAGRLYLAEDVTARQAMPSFDNSAMDGYGLHHEDTAPASETRLVTLRQMGEQPAGPANHTPLQPGEAIRIFTGAPVPPGVTAVIRQEDVTSTETGDITIRRPVRPGENIRRQGEEARPGDLVLARGQRVTPAAIAVLASQGIASVMVHCPPRVGVIVTGSEIVGAADVPADGMIRDSNSHTLTAALAGMGIGIAFSRVCPDDPESAAQIIRNGLHECDVLLITGGVSVGKHDYVKEATQRLGLQQIFWRVKQKPGKPLYFAASPDRKKIVFGLPGNPASVLTGFYEYVRPALLQMMGAADCAPRTALARLRGDYRKAAGLTHFLKGAIDAQARVQILEGQGSHMMASFAHANCLVLVDEATTELKEGDVVTIHVLPT